MKKWIFALACLSGTVFGAGNLTPNTAPAPTMKTLSELDDALTQTSNRAAQVEARIDILSLPAADGAMHAIQQPGSYYLSSHISVNEDYTAAILVDAEHVSIDLNGNRISRWLGTGGEGIKISPNATLTAIENGYIEGFEFGIYSQATNTSLESLYVEDCTSNGFHLVASAQLFNCRAKSNAGAGIYTEDGCVLMKCTAYKNSGIGIQTGNNSRLSKYGRGLQNTRSNSAQRLHGSRQRWRRNKNG